MPVVSIVVMILHDKWGVKNSRDIWTYHARKEQKNQMNSMCPFTENVYKIRQHNFACCLAFLIQVVFMCSH